MVAILTESQRSELHSALVGYLCSQNINNELVDQIRQELRVDKGTVVAAELLERKWAALVRVQRKLLEAEESITHLRSELDSMRVQAGSSNAGQSNAGPSSVSNYLPKLPPKFVLEGHRARVPCVAFHPKYSIVASGCEDGTIKIWDYENGEIERTVRAHTRCVHSLVFTPQSGMLVSASADLCIKVWDTNAQLANVLTLVGHDHTVSSVAVTQLGSSKKEYIISASRDKTVRIWDLNTGFTVKVLRCNTDWVRSLDVTNFADSDFQYILSTGTDRTVYLTKWGDTSVSTSKFEGHKHVVECCAFAPSASNKFIAKGCGDLEPGEICFASAGRDCVIRIWSSGHEDALMELTGHDNWVQGLAFHSNGRFLLSVSDDKTMRIWDLQNAKLVRTINAHHHFISCIAWKGKTIATGSVDQTVKIW